MTPASTSNNDANLLDDLTDADKAKILRRHLVSREERNLNLGEGTSATRRSPHGSVSSGSDGGELSKRPSSAQIRVQREDTEPFPVPYHAPGADVT